MLPGLILLSVAMVVSSAIIAKSGSSKKQEAPATAVVAEFDAVSIPVPIEPVPAGTKVSEIKLRNVSFPKHQVPEGALITLTGYTDSVTVAPLPANLPLFKRNLGAPGSAVNPVIDRIPPGMRAMTIKVDATAAVEGWAGSGAIVDVLLVEKDRTAVVAERVKILSAERSVNPIEGAAAPNVPSTVTLLVTQEQCLAINTAIPLGRIAFALRSARDDESWSDTDFTADRLKGVVNAPAKRSSISGYVSIKDGSASQKFALSNGQWIPTESVPDGFRVAEKVMEKLGEGDAKD
jgi:Flp pilus assembly protein CpaB